MKRFSTRLGDQEFAVIGLGRFGAGLALRLEETGHSVLGIDIRTDVVQRLADNLTAVVTLDATDDDALMAAGIKDFNTVIVAIGGDFEDAALCVAALKTIGVPNVIVQASSDRHRQLLERIGADRVVQPLQAGGRILAEELAFPALLKELSIGPDFIIAELKLPEDLVGKRLMDLDLREKYRINVLIIKRGNNMIVSPSAEKVLQKEDILVVLGPKNNVLHMVDR